jgi:hypothetical protein
MDKEKIESLVFAIRMDHTRLWNKIPETKVEVVRSSLRWVEDAENNL